ncbi:hypothetical protein LR48_Vigan01g104800 [Vigna angularis]|uniref:Uncharacterized protein n=1 Tax=Phaseolus angularis TaxID=3914 RepID=A0A0L9TLP2_PHAAN|nr:hypothetical protein LR48_Vigan01g104800 [Vigna angularis]
MTIFPFLHRESPSTSCHENHDRRNKTVSHARAHILRQVFKPANPEKPKPLRTLAPLPQDRRCAAQQRLYGHHVHLEKVSLDHRELHLRVATTRAERRRSRYFGLMRRNGCVQNSFRIRVFYFWDFFDCR